MTAPQMIPKFHQCEQSLTVARDFEWPLICDPDFSWLILF